MENKRKIKIVSDIDDTIYPSPHIKTIYPKEYKTIPGVLNVFNFLNVDKLDIIFLTARPSLCGILTKYTLKEMTKKTDGNLDSEFSFLTGYLFHVLLYVLYFIFGISILKRISDGYVSKAKYKSFVKLIEAEKDVDFYWFGDNSQGDLLTGQELIEKYDDNMKGVYIRNVYSNKNNVDCVRNWLRNKEYLNKNKVLIHNSYLQVGIDLYYRGVFNEHMLKILVEEYEKLVNNEKFTDHYQNEINKILIKYVRDVIL